LTENAAESIHGRILLVGVFAFTNLMRWIRPSFQIPNLDKSDVANESGLAVLTKKGDGFHCTRHLSGHIPRCVAVDPLRPELVYCGTTTQAVWCSEDAGENWRPAANGISHATVLAVAVSRHERIGGRGVVYAGTEPSAVFRSDDGGRTWSECGNLMDLPSSSAWSFPPRPETHHVRWIHLDPHNEGHLFVAIEAGALIRSKDGGKTWIDRVPTGPFDTHQMASHLSAPGRFYSAAGDGYFETTDGGETWQRIEEGLQHSYVWSVVVDPADPDTRVIASAASARAAHDKPSAKSFIYRRSASSEWQLARAGLPESTGRRAAVLAAHPTEPGTFFATWENDIFLSEDGGETWQRLEVTWPESFKIGEFRDLALHHRQNVPECSSARRFGRKASIVSATLYRPFFHKATRGYVDTDPLVRNLTNWISETELRFFSS